MPTGCKVCESDNQDEQEALGLLARDGELPWAEVQRRLELPNIKGIQNHMARHYVEPPSVEDRLDGEMEPLILDVVRELITAAEYAPTEVKPFYLVAIQNLKALKDTKPSQQHLINALKAIHEVTGMKMEQQLMLQFAQHRFGLGGNDAKAELEEHADVIELEPLE